MKRNTDTKFEMKLPEHILLPINILENAGFHAYVVGGAVRDAFLGEIPEDYDMTTDARPLQCTELFSERFRVIETGLAHGTITVLVGNFKVEITTFRIDGNYKDSRHPEKVEFTGNLALDLARRDFTVNALAYNPKDGLVDLYGGLRDINLKTVRCIGEPAARFDEDALRILRALRFSAKLDFEIDSNTAEALKDKSKLLEKISAERITAEISKLFESPFPERLGKILSDFKDVFSLVIPEIENSGNYNEICLKTPLVPPENNLRMIYFLCAVGYAHTENDRLRFSKVFTKRLGGISDILGKYDESDEAGSAFCSLFDAKMFVYRYGYELCFDAAGIIKHTSGSSRLLDCLEEIKLTGACVSLSGLSICGDDILRNCPGVKPEQIGKKLKECLVKVMSGELENSKPKIIDYINKHT